MIQHRFSREADAAASRYQLLTEAWRGIYSRTLDAPNFGTPARTLEAVEEAESVAKLFLDREYADLARIMPEIVREAHQTTIADFASIASSELTDEALELVSEFYDYLTREIMLQVHRDIATLQQQLGRVAREVSQVARVRNISRRSAVMEHRFSNKAGVNFVFHDRAARQWQSARFVRTVTRHSLLSLYNETVLSTIADHNVGTAEIAHASGSSSTHGLIVALHSNGSYPAYSEIRDEVFHPNSDAILKGVSV